MMKKGLITLMPMRFVFMRPILPVAFVSLFIPLLGNVRLNLFNHVLALFNIKFAYILAIRYPIFRWKLCKGCVWESVKKTQVVCIQRSLATGSRNWLMTSKSPKLPHVWRMQEAERSRKLEYFKTKSTV